MNVKFIFHQDKQYFIHFNCFIVYSNIIDEKVTIQISHNVMIWINMTYVTLLSIINSSRYKNISQYHCVNELIWYIQVMTSGPSTFQNTKTHIIWVYQWTVSKYMENDLMSMKQFKISKYDTIWLQKWTCMIKFIEWRDDYPSTQLRGPGNIILIYFM